MRVLLFFVPFLIYGGWLLLAGRRRIAVPRGPLPWAIAAVVGLALVALAWLGTSGGAPPGAQYVPPREAGGEIVPGHFEKAPP